MLINNLIKGSNSYSESHWKIVKAIQSEAQGYELKLREQTHLA
jgi:hypothetical protein